MTEIKDVNNIEFANLYLKTWIDIMCDEGTCKTWNNNTNWTETHLTILYKLAAELGYCNKDMEIAKKDDYGKTLQQEYYQVDFSLYKHYKDSYWNLDYAIEHENDVYNIYQVDEKDKIINKGWFDEFAKLLPLKCRRSRVIIGYDYFYNKEIKKDSNYTNKGAYTFEKKLDKCFGLLEDCRVQQTVSQSPILLIIFPSGWKMKQLINDEQLIEKPLIKIVNFPVEDGILKKEGVDITDEVLDEKMKDQLKEIYKKIKGGNVELELSRI